MAGVKPAFAMVSQKASAIAVKRAFSSAVSSSIIFAYASSSAVFSELTEDCTASSETLAGAEGFEVLPALCRPVLALLLAKVLEPVFNRYMAGDIGLDVAYSPLYIAAYILIVCLVGVISGLVPALMSFRHDPVSIIKGEQRRQTKSLFSKVFIIIQNVITVALIAMALVMEHQYNHLVNMPLGANVDNLYYISSGTVGRDALAAKPYVEKIGVSEGFPGKGNMSISTTVDGQKYHIRLLQCDETALNYSDSSRSRISASPRMVHYGSRSQLRGFIISMRRIKPRLRCST